MKLAEEMQSVDMAEIIDSMNAYAFSRLKSIGVKNLNGKEPIDFVEDVILKAMEGKRDREKAQCPLKEFLFGCLRSEISNFITTNKNRFNDTIPENLKADDSLTNIEEKGKQIFDLLCSAGADEDEQTIFLYWMDGILKPKEIAKDLGVEAKDIYNIIKRLERRLIKIKPQAISII